VIPRLAELEPAHSLTRDYLTALKAAGFRGEVAADAATRLVTATDNSVYQILPQAVIYPKDAADVVTAARIAGEARFSELTFAPRGGGTGTNGQSLATGVIVDVSRHLNQILDVDVARGLVRVQPGVVLDQLNRALYRGLGMHLGQAGTIGIDCPDGGSLRSQRGPCACAGGAGGQLP